MVQSDFDRNENGERCRDSEKNKTTEIPSKGADFNESQDILDPGTWPDSQAIDQGEHGNTDHCKDLCHSEEKAEPDSLNKWKKRHAKVAIDPDCVTKKAHHP